MAAKSPYGSVCVFGWAFESGAVALKAHGLIDCGIRHMLDMANGDRSRAVELMIILSHWHAAIVENNARERAPQIAAVQARKQARRDARPGPFSCVAICRVCDGFYMVRRKDHDAFINRAPVSEVVGICSAPCRAIQARQDRKRYRDSATKKHTRRARKYGVPYVSGITAAAVARRDHNKCQICKCKVRPYDGVWHPRLWSVGHIVALSQGGAHTWDNVQCECITCNSNKGIETKGQLCMPFAA